MKITITSIQLRSFFHFFSLSSQALSIVQQLKTSKHKEFKKTGFGKMHYTMTLWENEEDLKNFASSGAHLAAMKNSARIAREIKTITIDGEKLPTWTEAKEVLNTVKPILYS